MKYAERHVGSQFFTISNPGASRLKKQALRQSNERLQRQASQLDRADRVTVLGFFQESEAVVGHMRATSAVASPSTRDGFGITDAEAMTDCCLVVGAAHPDSAASKASRVLDGYIQANRADVPDEPSSAHMAVSMTACTRDGLGVFQRAT